MTRENRVVKGLNLIDHKLPLGKLRIRIKNNTEFNELIQQDKPILIDFYADWCGPCQTLLPIINDLADEHDGEIEIVKVNVDANQELVQKFRVRNIPALFFIKEGKIVENIQGVQPKSVLQSKLEALKAA
tara:strand:+ start:249 stop:638 length:390 start_codon:yes stop_codon:yes gene_type:complete